MLRSLAFVFLVTLIMACEKEKDSCNLPSFSGIFWTDVNGQPMSDPDPDDWTHDDEWNETESGFFDSALETNCAPSFEYWIAAYPNPLPEYNNGLLGIALGKDSLTSAELRIVDRQCHIIHTRDNEFSHNLAFNLSGYEGETLRMYYKFIKDGCEFRGHGDIKVE